MKRNKTNKVNGHNVNSARHLVHVEFSHPAATAVCIAGTFNDWRPECTPMASIGKGKWLKELVLPSGTYEYLFVADGHWLADPLAHATVPNPFGGVNSVITVPVDAKSNNQVQRYRQP